jgi:L-methionine (R)-S-oxide reductase
MNHLFTSLYQKFLVLKEHSGDLESLMAQTATLLQSEIGHYNWVGFYLLDTSENMLVLGPFQGAPTEHTHIPVGRGICGQVAESWETMTIQDVTQQDNYLACSLDVKSEIVVPIMRNGIFVAQIDIDSHAYAPFTSEDEQFLAAIATQLAEFF